MTSKLDTQSRNLDTQTTTLKASSKTMNTQAVPLFIRHKSLETASFVRRLLAIEQAEGWPALSLEDLDGLAHSDNRSGYPDQRMPLIMLWEESEPLQFNHEPAGSLTMTQETNRSRFIRVATRALPSSSAVANITGSAASLQWIAAQINAYRNASLAAFDRQLSKIRTVYRRHAPGYRTVSPPVRPALRNVLQLLRQFSGKAPAQLPWQILKFPHTGLSSRVLRDISQDWRQDADFDRQYFGLAVQQQSQPGFTLAALYTVQPSHHVTRSLARDTQAISLPPFAQALPPTLTVSDCDSAEPRAAALRVESRRGNRGMGRRHKKRVSGHLKHETGMASGSQSGRGSSRPAQSDGSGTDSHALHVYSQLIQQTPPEDQAAIARIGQQIRASRSAMQVTRRQLATLLHLEVELLVGLENGSGNLETARVVLERVQEIHAKHRTQSTLQ